MKLFRIFSLLGLLSFFSINAQQINPITRAMLNGYSEILKENPKDYQTLFERAAQYYQISQYDNALNDLKKAIEYTPAKDTDLRLREFSLLADASIETKDYELALKSINNALELQPENYANIYKKGNILLYLQRPQEAYRVFSSLQSLKSRSQEAYFGMAKASIMQQNFSEAEDLLKEAEKADPNNYITYCRVGDLYMDMNQPENAATNYLIGFSLADNSDRPLISLINLASQNYPAAAAAMDFAIEKSENKIPLLFLKGSIAEQSGNYSQAADALGQLLSNPEGQSAGVYLTMANAKMGLNDLDGALENVKKSIGITPSEPAFTLLSEIELTQGNTAQALTSATMAASLDSQSIEALLAKAKANIAAGDKTSALNNLNEIIMISPENLSALLLRAYVKQEMDKDAKGAIADLNRIITDIPEEPEDIAIKAIARAKAGKKLDADSDIEKGLLNSSTDKNALFWYAVYYAQTGDLAKSKDVLDRAVANGFQNQYLIISDSTPWQNLSPIRHLLK